MNRICYFLLLTFFLTACSTEPPLPPQQAERYITHKVRHSGETLGDISTWYTGTPSNWRAIADANPGIRVKRIQIGDVIQIPERLVKRTDPLPDTAITKPKRESAIAKADTASSKGNETRSNIEPSQSTLTQDAVESPALGKGSTVSAGATQLPPSPDNDLYMAVMISDPAQVKSALTAGANPSHAENNRPMLTWAAQSGNTEIVKALLEAKADVNATDGVGHTAIMRAADMGQLDAVKILVEAKPELNTRGPRGETAVMLATRSGHTDVVKTLMAAGADGNITDEDGNAPILIAAQDGNTAVIEALAAAHVDINISNIIYTPLSYAVDQDNKDLVSTLIAAGADPNAKTKNGNSPLLIALDNPEILSLLLNSKADPNITNGSGETALMVAVENDAKAAVESLIKAGANVNARSENGSTALSIAKTRVNQEIADLLAQSGGVD